MADALRRPGEPDLPNMNVVPPAAPLGSADAATTAGSTWRGDMDVDLPVVSEGTMEANQLRRGNPALDRAAREAGKLAGRAVNGVNRGLHVVRGGGTDSGTSTIDSMRYRASEATEDLKQRAGDLADDISDRASDIAGTARQRASEFADGARLRFDHMRQDAMIKLRSTRARSDRFINARPLQALGIAAGAGFLLGVGLALTKSKLGRS